MPDARKSALKIPPVFHGDGWSDDRWTTTKRRGGRRPIPPTIERKKYEHRVEGEGRICSTCGLEKTPFGHEICKVLDFEPGRFVLSEHMLEKLACRPCGDGVVTAEGPGKVFEGGIPGPGLLACILIVSASPIPAKSPPGEAFIWRSGSF